MRSKYLLPALLLCLHSKGFSDYDPLYAGTMLAFYSENIDPGHVAIQPYLFYTWQPGSYDSNWAFHHQKVQNSLSLLFLVETGITRWLDITLLATASDTWVNHTHSVRYSDTHAYLGFQILRDQKESWTPDFRLVLGESFPTGHYQHLDPERLLGDSSGTGSYETNFVAVVRKIFYTFPNHPFNLNLNLIYTLALKTHVRGPNVYGGTAGTHGTIEPGNQFLINLATEYSLTRNWVLGLDMRYLHQNTATFSGTRGHLPDGTRALCGLPSSEQVSLAPCIEYNLNENFGIIAGSWFTVAGRNTASFGSAIATVYYEF